MPEHRLIDVEAVGLGLRPGPGRLFPRRPARGRSAAGTAANGEHQGEQSDPAAHEQTLGERFRFPVLMLPRSLAGRQQFP
jgi:hypothetical protein